MGCGASTKYTLEEKPPDPTAPNNAASEEVKVSSLQEVQECQQNSAQAKGSTVRVAQIITNREVDDVYEKLGQLGSGVSGTVYKVQNKATGVQLALKRVSTARLSKLARDRLYNEVNISLLMDHPNIVRLVEIYEEEKSLALCMELCSGGALLNTVVAKKMCSERRAAQITKQMCHALAYLHSPSSPGGIICHRDLKVENFMFVSTSADASLKLIDFGLSKIQHHGAPMTLFAGTSHYFAPEVLNCCYDHHCDLWSLGVIVYMLLFGAPPFTVRSTAATHANIRRGRYRILRGVSSEAKDFLAQLLQLDPSQRTSAEDILGHPWIKHNEADFQKTEAADFLADENIIAEMRSYAASGVFKRAVLRLVSLNIPAPKLKELRNTFLAMDTGRQGVVTLQEFRNALSAINADEQIVQQYNQLFHDLDITQNDTIMYSEFLAACIHAKFDSEEYHDHIRDAFRMFDRDNSGAITADNLKEILGDEYHNTKVQDLMAECDKDGSGSIDIVEFMSYISGCAVADAVDSDKADGLVGADVDCKAEDDAGTCDIIQAGGVAPTATRQDNCAAGGELALRADAFQVINCVIDYVDQHS